MYITYLMKGYFKHYFFRTIVWLSEEKDIWWPALWYIKFYHTPIERWVPKPIWPYKKYKFRITLTKTLNQYTIAWMRFQNALNKSTPKQNEN